MLSREWLLEINLEVSDLKHAVIANVVGVSLRMLFRLNSFIHLHVDFMVEYFGVWRRSYDASQF